VLASLAAGAAAVPFFGSSAAARLTHAKRIRPPGALAEPEFLARCTRCGECMRVCVANGLQPAGLGEGGLAGLWSPVLVPRIGYCEYNCTLCGQVCPTAAIRRLPVEEKRQVKIGLADVDRSHCLPWKGASDCIVCEEHCPTPEKAIRLHQGEVMTLTGEVRSFKLPHVDERLCIGCGICETKCPLVERPAIVVSSRGETRAGGLLADPYG
jgi:MauM/NapG family ferredoxin protein